MGGTSRGPIMQRGWGSLLIHWSLRTSWRAVAVADRAHKNVLFAGTTRHRRVTRVWSKEIREKLVIPLDFEWLTYVNHHTALCHNSYLSNHCVQSNPSTSGSSNDSSQLLSSNSGTETQTGLGQRKGERRHTHQLFESVVTHQIDIAVFV